MSWPLTHPFCLVLSISLPPQRYHCWGDSRMRYFSASLPLRHHLPVLLTEPFSVQFHISHFCKKAQRPRLKR